MKLFVVITPYGKGKEYLVGRLSAARDGYYPIARCPSKETAETIVESLLIAKGHPLRSEKEA